MSRSYTTHGDEDDVEGSSVISGSSGDELLLEQKQPRDSAFPPRLSLLRWWVQHPRRQILRTKTLALLAATVTLIFLLNVPGWSVDLQSLRPTPNAFTLPSALPHIPSKIWQIYLAFKPESVSETNLHSFISHGPSHTYSILDAAGAEALVDYVGGTYSKYGRIREIYDSMTRTVIRADFLRFLVLAVEGGVYSDVDTTMVRPLRDWVPEELRDRTKLIIGLEADAGVGNNGEELIGGTSYKVQFCQWTIAGASGHPVFWAMVDRVIDRVTERLTDGKTGFSNADVLAFGGPAGLTEVVYAYLSGIAGRTLTAEDFSGMKEPKFFGDTLVLPIDGFATGVPHSGASPANQYTNQTMVLHEFHGGWKGGK